MSIDTTKIKFDFYENKQNLFLKMDFDKDVQEEKNQK